MQSRSSSETEKLTAIDDLSGMCLGLGQLARRASLERQDLSTAVKNRWLLACAKALRESTSEILAANALDVAKAPEYGLTDAAIDRLIINEKRLEAICCSLESLAALTDPVGEILSGSTRPNGLQIQKVRVPIGVTLFKYGSLSNV